jgi:hypothetical protein
VEFNINDNYEIIFFRNNSKNPNSTELIANPTLSIIPVDDGSEIKPYSLPPAGKIGCSFSISNKSTKTFTVAEVKADAYKLITDICVIMRRMLINASREDIACFENHLAAIANFEPAFNLLIKYGAILAIKDDRGNTADVYLERARQVHMRSNRQVRF